MQFFKARQLDMHILQTLWHFQASFLASLSLTWNALPTKSKPPLSSCKVNSRDIQTQPFPQPCATPICLPKGTAKEQGHGRKSYKVFSLNPLYQIEEDYWNICLNKSWGMNNPAILSPKVLNHTKFVAWQCIFLHSGLTLNHAFSLGHGFSIIKVLPTPDKRAQQRNKGMAEKHTKSSV